MKSPIVDFHVHAFPEWIPPSVLQSLEPLRKRARGWVKPISSTLHQGHTLVRHLPGPVRNFVDQMSGFAPLTGLAIESSLSDMMEGMDEASIQNAVFVAHPPLVSNDFVIETSQADSRLIAAVNLPVGTERATAKLKAYLEKGAKILKIHPAADGEGPKSSHYKALLKVASDCNIPIILHTGRIKNRVLYKNSELGDAELYKPWFKNYPQTRFILAHMNFHAPNVALDLGQDFGNVYVDTSWQPAEMIGEAVRRIGADRVLFASDWPFLGNNFRVGIRRVEECVEMGTLNENQSRLILGENALKLLSL